MNLRKYAAASELAENAYKSTITLAELNKEFTFSHFREMAAQTRKEIEADKISMKAENDAIIKMFSQKEALKRIEENRKTYELTVEVAQDALRRELKNIVSVKAEQLQRNVTTPPKPEVASLLQIIAMRKGEISEAEFNMLISVTANNYLAMSVLHDIAAAQDYDFRMPFTPDRYVSDLEEITDILTNAISELGADGLSYRSAEFYDFTAETNPNGYLTGKFADLDFAPALSVTLPTQTLKEKLESFIDAKLNAAADKAVNGEDGNSEYKDALKAKQFLDSNKDIATEEDAAHAEQARRTELENKAAEIMSSANE